MQILRIILMVCFVFTVYPSIGEAVDIEAVDIEAVDIGEGSKTKSTLKATAPRNESKPPQPPHPPMLGNVSGGTALIEAESVSESTHLNERILQLQKKELDKSLNLHDSRLHVEGGSAGESEKSEREAGEPLKMKYREHGSELIHLNERILQLQKKELDKSIDTSTEDDGY